MRKIYLVRSAESEKAKRLFKQGIKLENLSYRIETNNLWACKELDEAKEDCREYNKRKDYWFYWYEEIKLY